MKTLDEIAKEIRNSGPDDFTPFPEEFAKMVGKMMDDSPCHHNIHHAQATTFVTASGLAFLHRQPDCE